jgi:hypothetical protein
MRRNQVFKNTKLIIKFGLLGTILSFVIYSLVTYYANKLGILKYKNSDGEYVQTNLDLFEILSICCILSSGD